MLREHEVHIALTGGALRSILESDDTAYHPAKERGEELHVVGSLQMVRPDIACGDQEGHSMPAPYEAAIGDLSAMVLPPKPSLKLSDSESRGSSNDSDVTRLKIARERFDDAIDRISEAGNDTYDRQTGESVILQSIGVQSKALNSKMSSRKFDEVLRESASVEEDVLHSTWYQSLVIDLDAQLATFDTVLGVVVLLNALYLGIAVDNSPNWIGWTVFDVCFAMAFVSEVLIKCYLLGLREYFLGSDLAWHYFEVVLAIAAVLEIVLDLATMGEDGGVLWSMFRVVKALRMTRVFMVCQLDMFAELQIMVKGTIGGAKTLIWASVLLSLPVYVLSLIMRDMLGDTQDQITEEFAKFPTAFFTVFRCIVAGDCADTRGHPIWLNLTKTHGWGYGALYCAVTIFVCFGLFNVIIALFIENVVIASKTDVKRKRRERLRDQSFFAKKMIELITTLLRLKDESEEPERRHIRKSLSKRTSHESSSKSTVDILKRGSKMEITPDLFEQLRLDTEAIEIFADLDIADDDRFSLFETLDVDGSGTIDLPELIDGISKLRGEARRSDIVSIDFMLKHLSSQVNDSFDKMFRRLINLESQL